MNMTITNPAPRDRVLLTCSYEGHFGPWLPQWRVGAPGHSVVETCVGDSYAKFLRFWGAVAWAIYSWDCRGRPACVFSHQTKADQEWLKSGG